MKLVQVFSLTNSKLQSNAKTELKVLVKAPMEYGSTDQYANVLTDIPAHSHQFFTAH